MGYKWIRRASPWAKRAIEAIRELDAERDATRDDRERAIKLQEHYSEQLRAAQEDLAAAQDVLASVRAERDSALGALEALRAETAGPCAICAVYRRQMQAAQAVLEGGDTAKELELRATVERLLDETADLRGNNPGIPNSCAEPVKVRMRPANIMQAAWSETSYDPGEDNDVHEPEPASPQVVIASFDGKRRELVADPEGNVWIGGERYSVVEKDGGGCGKDARAPVG
jgi:hypothetical protein